MKNEDFDWIRNDLALNLDILATTLGELIGEGYSRKVFEHKQDKSLVVKLATCQEGVKCNVNEAHLWLDNVHWFQNNLEWVKEWFAPVVYASPNYNVILMKKTEPKLHKKKPNEIPSFFTDTHSGNFGWIGNKFVCHDYGSIHGILEFKKRFKKNEWH